MKKILSLLLVLALLAGFIPEVNFSALAVDKGTITFRATSGTTLTQAMVTAQLNAAGVGTNDTFSAAFDSSVTNIGDRAFNGRYYLTSVVIPDSVMSIGDYAFFNCTSLTSVIIGNGVTTIGEAPFASCWRLTNINVSLGNTNYSSLDGTLFDKAKTTLIQYPGGKSGGYTIPDGVKTIANYAFYGCLLTSIVIPDSVTGIGNYAFSDSSLLTRVVIPDSVTITGDYTFL